MQKPSGTGKLVVVPTPIGNLGDVTLRSLDALRSADAIYAEDTRVTGRLLSALECDAAKPRRLDENTLASKVDEVAARIAAGDVVAYCTDAGMPGVSDPGMRLVAAMRERGLPVEVLPGASAASTAYVASGFSATSYFFGGFFPRKQGDRASRLAGLADLDAALVFYESPKRLASALKAVADAFPSRCVAVCRELTKLHEEVVVLPSGEAAELFAQREAEGGVKGEVAFVIDAPAAEEGERNVADAVEQAREAAVGLVREGMRQKDAAKLLSERFGLPRNEAYALALSAKESLDEA